MNHELTQGEFEDLSAWLDGELSAEGARKVERLVREDAAWSRAAAELKATDRALDAWTVPAPTADLSERIIESCSARRRRTIALRWIAAGAAVAALVVAAVALTYVARRGEPTPSDDRIARQDDGAPTNGALQDAPPSPGANVVDARLEGVSPKDRFVVENLDFFRNYDVLVNLETIEAVERQDARAATTGT